MSRKDEGFLLYTLGMFIGAILGLLILAIFI